jgi:YidC/Oxa1 family membrane protein insertase
MSDLRRTILWVIFTLSLVMLWDRWQIHNGRPGLFSVPQPVSTAPAVASASGALAAATPSASGSTGATPAGSSLNAVPGSTVSSVAVDMPLVEVSTDVFKATLSPVGGSLVKLELLKHIDQNDRRKNVMLFDQSKERVYVAQTGFIGGDFPSHKSVMKVLPGPRSLSNGKNELTVVLESEPQGGLKWVKTLTFKRGDYVIGVKHQLFNVGSQPLAPQLYVQLLRDGNKPLGESSFYSTFTGPAIYNEAHKFTKLEFEAIEKGKTDFEKQADNGYVAMVQHYFASAWLLPERQGREFYARKVDNNLYAVGMILQPQQLAPGASVGLESSLFAGPQQERMLENLAPGLELVKDYGWLTILAKPLFWLLEKLYELIRNWGWSIVALVVLLKAAFYWLNAKAYASMAKMKELSPKLNDLRERYKEKPQEMQQAMMNLYREQGVNPMGGCLPILIQIPVFIALYWVLLSSVEMRNAPWLGWIHDLSIADPYFILPLIMTGTTVLQTWLNPTPADPMQAKLMWIMPLAFSVMFFFFPAGLVSPRQRGVARSGWCVCLALILPTLRKPCVGKCWCRGMRITCRCAKPRVRSLTAGWLCFSPRPILIPAKTCSNCKFTVDPWFYSFYWPGVCLWLQAFYRACAWLNPVSSRSGPFSMTNWIWRRPKPSAI